MADQPDDNPRAPAARRSVHSCTDDFPNFTDVVANPKDDPVLVKLAGIGALAKGLEQLESLDGEALANLRYELIDQHVAMAMRDGCSREEAIGYARGRFGIGKRTVETAIDYVKKNAERTSTPDVKAGVVPFNATEAESKAIAKQRFVRAVVTRALWLKGARKPALLEKLESWLKLKR
jgi:hypothetical protein